MRWLGPLLAVFVAQIAVTFLSRLAPTLAPALSTTLQWSLTEVGYLTSIVGVGSVIFLLVGLPLVLRAGPVRSLQLGLAVGAVGTLLYAVPTAASVVVGSLLIGLSAGPQASAGSDVLRRYAPAGSHNLVFSFKQAGVPLGGVLAGLLLPGLVDSVGLTATFLVCAACAVATLLAVQPLQRQLDATRDRQQATDLRLLVSLSNLKRPLRSVLLDANLRRVTAVGVCLAFGQGMWFTFLISYLVQYMGVSLAAAGALFAVMQVVSTFGRPAMGWLADRLSAVTMLKAVCIASSLTTAALAMLTPQWPHWTVLTLMAAAGCTVSSWNGVQMAQVAHLAPPGAVAESTTGSTLVVFMATILGPLFFGAIVALGGDFRVGFWFAAVCTLAALLPLAKLAKAVNR